MSKVIKTVDEAEFEKRKKESLHVKPCPFCGSKIKLVVSFPNQEAETVAFQCERCGYSLEGFIPTEYFSCGDTLGTFKTADCISRAILNLVYLWNSQVEYENRKQASEQRNNQCCSKLKGVTTDV